jgi:phenylpropionate dioxygenase-like ring-hydroxylating dioxygenase large terminal subunit
MGAKKAAKAIRKSIDNGVGLAADCYRDADFFGLELEKVLRPAWHAIARWDESPDVGDFSAVELFGEPLVIVRGEDRNLRVFSNVCPHRAHTVATESGNTKTLVCPYHRWAFGLDGALRAAPLMKGTAGFDPANCGLAEIQTETWQGFVFVSLEKDPAPLGAQLGELDQRLESEGIAEMISVGLLEFDSPWNWKVMVDNFMESYHHLGIHVDSLQKTNPAKDTYGADMKGPFSVLENPGLEADSSFLVGQVFPTLLFSVIEVPRFGVWYEMQIDRHDHFQLRIHILAAPEIAAVDGAAEALVENVGHIHGEDIPACQAVQTGLGSRLWKPGPLNVRELCLTRFHDYLANRLGA